ncbi:unnamed protein product [Diplocarpon coronariae]|nr:hypothetical protein JHW43_005691 [Diplocarpon mali]
MVVQDTTGPRVPRGAADSRQQTADSRQQSRTLTPRQRLRQPEPSWLRNGHTTSLLTSDTEKDDVRADRGGIVFADEEAGIPGGTVEGSPIR